MRMKGWQPTVRIGWVTAPTPRVATEAAKASRQRQTAKRRMKPAGAAVAGATPLSQNGYKVQLARVAVNAH
jgi:hypothetical protein